MGLLEFIAALTSYLAWPLTVFVIVLFLRQPLRGAFSRITSLKHGQTEATFAAINKQIIEKQLSPKEKKELTSHQVIAMAVGTAGYYRLYSNGVLVQRFRITVMPGERRKSVSYMIAVPNEATNAEFLGDIDANLLEMDQTTLTFSCVPASTSREIEVIITGL